MPALAILLIGLVSECACFAKPHLVSSTIPSAYVQVAQDYGIPPVVFYSVMVQESGKSVPGLDRANTRTLPWPWVLNVELKPYFYSDKKSAQLALKQFMALKNQRIAVGPGQIYLPSHGHLFSDPTMLLEPETNLTYAAKLLANEFQWTLDQGKPNWWVAVGRYHTPSREDLASAYRRDVFNRCTKIFEHCTVFGAIH